LGEVRGLSKGPLGLIKGSKGPRLPDGQFQKVLARRISLWPETYFWPTSGQISLCHLKKQK